MGSAPHGLGVLGIVIAMKSESAARAWRRLLLASGATAFALPLTIVSVALGIGPFAGAALVMGSYLGGLLAIGVGGAGLLLGVVLLVIGLLVGRRRAVPAQGSGGVGGIVSWAGSRLGREARATNRENRASAVERLLRGARASLP